MSVRTPSILFVCLGNICRSPTAEAVLRTLAPNLTIDSAGTSDWHIGDAPYAPAVTAAAKRGYDMSALRARQVAPNDFRTFDLVLAMDGKNLADLRDIAPPDSKAALNLFLDYAPETGASEVPDPYYTRDFDGALDLIEAAAKGLLRSL